MIEHVIGLDLSICHTGWCHYTQGKPLEYGVIEPPELPKPKKGQPAPDKTMQAKMKHNLDRMEFILNKLALIFAGIRTDDILVIVEDFAPLAKGSAVHQLAGLGYLVRRELSRAGVPIMTPTPTQAKKFLIGKGIGGKDLILKEVLAKYKINVDNDNIADAINMCMIGRAVVGQFDKPLVHHRAIVADLCRQFPGVAAAVTAQVAAAA